MDSVAIRRDVPIVAEADVVVVGAGPAGVTAAVAASASGARTVLIDQFGYAGGMATAGLVGPILGVYHWPTGKRILGGIPYQILQLMQESGGAELVNEGMLVPFDPEVMKHVCDTLLLANNVHVHYHTFATDVVLKDGRIDAVIAAVKTGLVAFRGSVYIDATGDGDVAAAAGVPYTLGNPDGTGCQPMTTVFRIGGLRSGDIRDSENPDTGYVATEVRDVLLDAESRALIPRFGGPWIMRGSTLRDGEAFVNMVRQWGDPTDAVTQSRCEIHGRDDMFRLVDYLRRNVKALASCYIIDSGATIGVRDSRHFAGRYVQTIDDVMGKGGLSRFNCARRPHCGYSQYTGRQRSAPEEHSLLRNSGQDPAGSRDR